MPASKRSAHLQKQMIPSIVSSAKGRIPTELYQRLSPILVGASLPEAAVGDVVTVLVGPAALAGINLLSILFWKAVYLQMQRFFLWLPCSIFQFPIQTPAS
jgi:hypothetical protein